MTKNDVLLLMTHGALSGVCSRPPISTSADLGRQAVEAAQHAVDVLAGSGFLFDDDTLVEPPMTVAVSGYDSSGAVNSDHAKEIAKTILHSDENLKDVNTQTLRDFQYAAGLKPDGIAGPKTLGAYLYWSAQVV